MKKLTGNDLFAAMRLVKKSGAKQELIPVIKGIASGDDVESVGILGIMTIIEAASARAVEDAVWEFLAAPFEMTAEEVGSMELSKLMDCIEQLVAENDLADFFGRLCRLTISKG